MWSQEDSSKYCLLYLHLLDIYVNGTHIVAIAHRLELNHHIASLCTTRALRPSSPRFRNVRIMTW